MTAKAIYDFIEKNESLLTSGMTAVWALFFIQVYFSWKGSENFGQLTKEEEKKLKKAKKRIDRALRLSDSSSNSKSKIAKLVAKLRGGSSSRITAKQIATKVAMIIVQAARDGSFDAIALIVACNMHPKGDILLKTICFGDKNGTLVKEIANHLYKKRRRIIQHLVLNAESRENFNKILLELEIIKKPLTRMELIDLSVYSVTMFEIPLVKWSLITTRALLLLYLTNKIRQGITSRLGQEITRGFFAGLLAAISDSKTPTISGTELAEIEKLKQQVISRPTFKGMIAPAPEGSVKILNPMFNDEIIDFIEVDPVVERIFNTALFNKNRLIQYSPKFNVDYVIERLIMGNDISKLPIDHITNLW